MKAEPEFRLLCLALTGGAPEELSRLCALADWERVIALAAEEMVLPLLYDRVLYDRVPGEGCSGDTSAGTGTPLPLPYSSDSDSGYAALRVRDQDRRSRLSYLDSRILEVLRGVRDAHALRNEAVLEEIRAVAALANGIGIEPVALKGGAHLIAGLYPAVSDRYMVDLDLLVPEGKVAALRDRMLEGGYEYDGVSVGVDCHHERGLKRPGMPTVEIHGSLGMGRTRRLLPADDLIRESVAVRFRGAMVRVPSQRHLAIHHALHGELSHAYWQAIRPTLREAYDCFLLAGVSLPGRAKAPVLPAVLLHWRTAEEVLGISLGLPPVRRFSAEYFELLHRRVLRRWPGLRFADPYYLVRAAAMPRLRRLRGLMKDERGLRYLLGTPFRRSFYRNVRKELFGSGM